MMVILLPLFNFARKVIEGEGGDAISRTYGHDDDDSFALGQGGDMQGL